LYGLGRRGVNRNLAACPGGWTAPPRGCSRAAGL